MYFPQQSFEKTCINFAYNIHSSFDFKYYMSKFKYIAESFLSINELLLYINKPHYIDQTNVHNILSIL